MATAAENLASAREWMQAMMEWDPAKMGSMAAEDVKVMEVAEGEVHEGRDYLIWAYEDLFSAYPDCTCEIINGFAGDDQVMIEVQWRGTETGSVSGPTPQRGQGRPPYRLHLQVRRRPHSGDYRVLRRRHAREAAER